MGMTSLTDALRITVTAVAVAFPLCACPVAQAASADKALASALEGLGPPPQANQLLSPEKAFSARASLNGDHVSLIFQAAEGYYLYRDRISVVASPKDQIGQPAFPDGEVKTDQFFGRQVIYRHGAYVVVPLASSFKGALKIKVTYQGCAVVGVCYPPQTREFSFARP
ncbi:Thiol:disulfide interchange protein-like protein (plasmid) [Burkholderia vietnamiensis G4]|uniref:Thiol:disulfide interchange protein-like protein n=1 Tax=Burkholderia vietnamiensis (strain G4 / LMG 22486) TaxID=269482 RepID=A4JU51_BURVG|nr:Thiol:disulfide interchange protein-like protein [Burkholderia vietnamiensis G4]